MSAVWAGAPEGTPWNVPTAAIENADTTPTPTFVGPTEQAAAAAETGSGITLDPSTNLVTFNPQPTNAAAYNNYLMVESYLVVPTSGLASAQAIKLAQFIRYVLGPTGQSDIAVLGAAPATPAEVTAGLKVASELDAEATSTASSGVRRVVGTVRGHRRHGDDGPRHERRSRRGTRADRLGPTGVIGRTPRHPHSPPPVPIRCPSCWWGRRVIGFGGHRAMASTTKDEDMTVAPYPDQGWPPPPPPPPPGWDAATTPVAGRRPPPPPAGYAPPPVRSRRRCEPTT